MDALVAFTFFFAAGYGYWWLTKKSARSGTFTVREHTYAYDIGNNLTRFTAEDPGFHGIDIALPKELPHMYLDSHKDDKFRGPTYAIDASNRLSLEGNFDRHFQVFAPKGYEVLALSILSPDVMQTLIQSAERYDIEIFGSHLRIISMSRIFGNTEKEKDVMAVAQKVLHEVDHRLRSWSKADSENAHRMLLRLHNDRTIKAPGIKYIRLSNLLAFLVLVIFTTVLLIASFVIEELQGRPLARLVMIGLGLTPLLLFLIVAFQKGNYFRHR